MSELLASSSSFGLATAIQYQILNNQIERKLTSIASHKPYSALISKGAKFC